MHVSNYISENKYAVDIIMVIGTENEIDKQNSGRDSLILLFTNVLGNSINPCLLFLAMAKIGK